MFYSHEILTSRQYGVATIWLVATIGSKSSTKKVTRKAIQEVDVQKACGKILEPGAPIALRLQSNLLYGVTRVYNHQCTYMLSDTQKIQQHMNLFIRQFGGNQLDPDAGHARPENLVIMNDPDFIPNMQLPQFDLDAFVASQGTQKTSSQMSPIQNSLLSGSGSPGPGFAAQLDLPHSDSSGPRGSPFGLQGLSSAQKPDDEPMTFTQEDEFAGAGDWGLEIDEHGNIVESAGPLVIQDEPDLPPLPHRQGEDREQLHEEQVEERPIVDEQGDVIMMEEQPLPEAEALPGRPEHDPFQDDEPLVQEAPARRKRRRRRIQADEETQLSRNIIKGWQADYLQNCTVKAARPVGAKRAKENAMWLTFGRGLGDIGQNLGAPGMIHPLKTLFSGDSLFTALTGLEVLDQPRGRRRSASEAMEDSDEQAERRVRPRLEEADVDQQGRGQADENVFNVLDGDPFVDQGQPEVGREAEPAMSDQHSSAMPMPWNRGSSVMPGSSIRGPGSAQPGRIISSPLKGRGDSQDIVRYSDDAPMGFGDDVFGLGGLHSQDSSFDGLPLPDGDQEGKDGEHAQNESQRASLDTENKNFLNFMEGAIRDNGEMRQDEDLELGRKWVAFDDIFVPHDTSRAMAAQAFYNTLCLMTKGKLHVEQEVEENKPFGGIWVGAKVQLAF